jgi:ABC-2 type transport system ATP-binding protein
LINELHGETRVHFTSSNGFEPNQLSGVAGVTSVAQENNHITVSGHGPLLARVAAALAEHTVAPADLRVDHASLEDVFLALTGKTIRD